MIVVCYQDINIDQDLVDLIKMELDASFCYEANEFASLALELAFLEGIDDRLFFERTAGLFSDFLDAPLAFLQNLPKTTVQTKFAKSICNLFCNFHPPTCARENLFSVFVFSELIIKNRVKYCKKLNKALKIGLY